MRLEIGNQMTIIEALEIIRNNNEGIFVCENGKIYFDTGRIPILINQHFQQQPQRRGFNSFGELLSSMSGGQR